MLNRRKEIRKYLADLVFLAVLHSIIISLLVFLSNKIPMFNSAGKKEILVAFWLLLPFAFMSVIKRELPSPLLFFVFQLLPCAIVFLLPFNLLERILYMAFLLISALYSFQTRLKGDMELTKALAFFVLCVNAVLVIIATKLGFNYLTPYLAGWAVVVIISFIVCRQTTAIDLQLKVKTKSVRAYSNSIIKSSNILLLFLIFATLVLLLFSPLIPIEDILSLIWGFLRMGLTFVFGLFKTKTPEQAEEIIMAEQQENFDNVMPQATEANPVLAIIMNILQFVFLAACIIFILYAIVRLVFNFMKRINSAKISKDNDLNEFILPDLSIDKLPELFKRMNPLKSEFGSGEEAKIRRKYYKKIKKQIRQGANIRNSDTCAEIEQKLSELTDVKDLTKVYEEARYNSR